LHGIPWEPFPEFRDSNSAEWKLTEAIIKRFTQSAAKAPLVIVPTFYDNHVRYHMSGQYWYWFKGLEQISVVYVVDLLSHFQKLGAEAVRCFQDPYDTHK
jgi:hypothetical protein